MNNLYREIPDHEHDHSVYTRCLNCFMFGIDFPRKFNEVGSCGNCGSFETIVYYPKCCIIADRKEEKQ